MKTILTFIGYGNMAQAMAHCFKERHVMEQINVSSPSLNAKMLELPLKGFNNNLEAVRDAEIIILAIKPKDIKSVLNEIAGHISSSVVIISIVAGITIDEIASYFTTEQPIIRAMPNTPIAVGVGATGLFANPYVCSSQKIVVEELFASTGIAEWVENEADINAITALSGSGPAYILLMIEAMTQAAEALNLNPAVASRFALQTVKGATELMEQTGESASVLRHRVTSPNGTTAAALDVFAKHNFKQIINDALKAAYTRATELSQINLTL